MCTLDQDDYDDDDDDDGGGADGGSSDDVFRHHLTSILICQCVLEMQYFPHIQQENLLLVSSQTMSLRGIRDHVTPGCQRTCH